MTRKNDKKKNGNFIISHVLNGNGEGLMITD